MLLHAFCGLYHEITKVYFIDISLLLNMVLEERLLLQLRVVP